MYLFPPMKPRLLVPSLIAFFVLVLAGCAPQPQPQDCSRDEVVCAGLVTDFGGVDTGINHEAWLGLQDAKAAGLVDRIDYIATVDRRDRAANISALADQGYDVIVTSGFSMSQATTAAAGQYKKIKFIGIEQPQDQKLRNLAGLVFHEEQSGFLAGALAALVSQTRSVAAVCDAKFVDSMRRYCDGFAAGARYAQPDVQVSTRYREGPNDRLFNDPQWGAAAAAQDVQNGADVLFAAGGNTARVALEAAASDHILVIGSETDLYGELPGLQAELLSSATNNVRLGVLDLVRQAGAKSFPSGNYFGEVGLAQLHDLDRQIPLGVKQDVERLKIGLQTGAISIDVPYTAP